jgi:hypothetical protein
MVKKLIRLNHLAENASLTGWEVTDWTPLETLGVGDA